MKRLTRTLLAATMLAGLAPLSSAAFAQSPDAAAADKDKPKRNLILFVADGLRNGSVDGELTPTLDRLRKDGVYFRNSHSIFPTFTTANASAMATVHYLGDTGDFSNTIFAGFPEQAANGSVTPFLENDVVLGDIDEHFQSTLKVKGETVETGYLDEETILAAARGAGYRTAAIGKVGPVAIFDHENSLLIDGAPRDDRGVRSIIVDDATGSASGIPLDPEFSAALAAAGVPTAAPGRGANGASGNNVTPGTKVPNLIQQDYFVQATSDVILPEFKADGRPFVMVFWSRDPDGTQHNHGDSLNRLTPGINGRTPKSAVANADSDLARLMDALDRLKLTKNTDVVVTSDHGFSTISKNSGAKFTAHSRTSYAATETYKAYRLVDGSAQLQQEVETGFLPVGFLAIDIAHVLEKSLHDPDSAPASAPRPITPASYPPVDPTQSPAADGSRRQRPANGNGVIGDVSNPDVVVAANGGSDLVYLPNAATAKEVAAKLIPFLEKQDYVSGLFVDDGLGTYDGTLPLSDINLQGKAITPVPTIVVNFASGTTRGDGCKEETDEQCGVEIADSGLQQGQGMHGGFSRADTYNFTAAIGPDFKQGFVDKAPVSNADVGQTVVAALGIKVPDNGKLVGRVLKEAFKGGGDTPDFKTDEIRSKPGAKGVETVIKLQTVGDTKYFDAAGFPGRTLGVDK